MFRKVGLVLAVFMVAGMASASVEVNSLFTSGGVLQQGMDVPVWGTASDGERVCVKICGQSRTTVAKDGKWMVRLSPMKAGGPFTMYVNSQKIDDILVGEVWLCSGQSNMEFTLQSASNADAALASCVDSQIRLYKVAKNSQGKPVTDAKSSWAQCNSASASDFSAVAYFFGQEIRKARNVPVGLIDSAYGGTILQAWASTDALLKDKESRGFMANVPDWATGQNTFGGLYNGMIAPLAPYAIRGALWYQGESNIGGGYYYRNLLPLLISNWRDAWGEGNFPFLIVQIAPYGAKTDSPVDSHEAELRESQLVASRTCPNTGIAITTDVGDEKDIHPRDKETVGKRLALAARGIAYGEKIEYLAPAYKSMTIKGNRVVLEFDKPLVCKGSQVTGFIVCGKDGKFVNANAKLVGSRVVVSSDQVAEPVAVRYGWADYPELNLYGLSGLPVSPFRTDSSILSTQPR